MLNSILDDVKTQFSYGNMITRIILVNVFVFLFIIIVKAFTGANPAIYNGLIEYLALPSDGWKLLTRPWTLFTNIILHEGVWHLGWNMLMLYWFGRIVGDLAGDKRILPLYILGGLAGGILFFIYWNLLGNNAPLLGASGAVNCFIVAGACLAPEYNIRLLLIGDVKLKYVAFVLVVLSIVGIANQSNAGGNMAHIGGAIMGAVFVYMLKKGVDLTDPFPGGVSLFSSKKTTKGKAPMTVIHNKIKPSRPKESKSRSLGTQEKIDQILDKINATGYDSLSAEEKDFLYQASKD